MAQPGRTKVERPPSTKRYFIFGQCTANYWRTHRKLSWVRFVVKLTLLSCYLILLLWTVLFLMFHCWSLRIKMIISKFEFVHDDAAKYFKDKQTVNVVQSDPPCNANARFITIHLKPLSDQVWIRCFFLFNLFDFICATQWTRVNLNANWMCRPDPIL